MDDTRIDNDSPEPIEEIEAVFDDEREAGADFEEEIESLEVDFDDEIRDGELAFESLPEATSVASEQPKIAGLPPVRIGPPPSLAAPPSEENFSPESSLTEQEISVSIEKSRSMPEDPDFGPEKDLASNQDEPSPGGIPPKRSGPPPRLIDEEILLADFDPHPAARAPAHTLRPERPAGPIRRDLPDQLEEEPESPKRYRLGRGGRNLAAVAFGGSSQIGFGCPACGYHLSATADRAGSITRCGHCGSEVAIPESDNEPDDEHFETDSSASLQIDYSRTVPGALQQRKLGIPKMGGIIFSLIAVIFGIVAISKKNQDAAQAIESSQSLKTSSTENVLGRKLRDIITKYFELETFEERVLLIRNRENIEHVMLSQFATQGGARLRPNFDINSVHEVEHNGVRLQAMEGTVEEKPITVYFEPSGDSYLIDWPTLVGHSDSFWPAFVSIEDPEPATFRIYVREGDYYKYDFKDAREYYCLKFTNMAETAGCFGYLPRNSEAATRISDAIAAAGKASWLPVTATLRFNNSGSKRNQAHIDAITTGWLN